VPKEQLNTTDLVGYCWH